ncbi:ABC transporter ATP-binding protein [Pleionea sp. CnH1-48]|uniref:ABC transporter ATP-binding protein n=1 Tax=Pleionea sp. CnH1-48 TaxID=2954494 RepID=UPI0020969A63|nr:ABC transporter ATP-binding protein [Pleionea sp. CnH1-48]MCO7225606.1 ABC transporter ATP-binding protein/permease [Pleionea sp. CnH1-48]
MKDEKASYRKLFELIKLAKPGRALLVTIALLTLLSSASSLLFPMLTQKLVDSYSSLGAVSNEFLWILIAVLIAGVAAAGVNTYLIGRVSNRMLVHLRQSLLGKIFYFPVRFFDKETSAEPASRVVNDTDVINEVVAQHFEPFISGMVTVIASLIILWVLDWQLTLVLFGCLAASFLITIPVAGRLNAISTEIQSTEASFLGRITEVFSQIRLIKSFGTEQRELQRCDEKLNKLYKLGQKEVVIMAVMAPIAGITITAAMIAILVFGATRVAQGDITLGTLIAFILYLFNIVFPLIQFSMFFAGLNKAAGAAERIHTLMHSEVEQLDQGAPVADGMQDIHFEQVDFGYGEDKKIIKELSVSFAAGKTTALVGGSGAGKTTLFSLLLGFYLHQQGQIRYGEQNVAELRGADWRDKIAYIAQDTPLLSGTLRHNLSYGVKGEVTDEAIAEVLKQTQLADFVKELPQGLDTEVGEDGVCLSGGQRQRVAIARALLCQSPILLCDEATAHLDAITEQQLQTAMKPLQAQSTTLVAAHRLSTVMEADQIIVLADGTVSAQGTHDELMESSDYYRELVETQFIRHQPLATSSAA